jgi:manganese/zinc/iron transport system permease protein
MQPRDVLLMASIAAAAMFATILLLKEFTIVCFNDAFARVDGWPVSFIDLLMMGLVVVVTVAGLQAVGLILVVSLLIIPPVAARFWTDRLPRLVVIAACIGAFSGYTGSVVSALFPRKPAGAVIVLTAGVLFTISLFLAPKRGFIALSIRRLRVRLKVAGDHVLEYAYDQGFSVIERTEFTSLSRLHAWSLPYSRLIRWSLRLEGMIHFAQNGGISITQAGARRGARVSRNHSLWEQYLVSYADIAPSHVDWSVDLVEHVISEELVHELEAALRKRGIQIPEFMPEGRA